MSISEVWIRLLINFGKYIMGSSIVTFDKVYLSIPSESRQWASENGLKYNPTAKSWFIPPGKDPLPFRKYWSVLEKTYKDRSELKERGCEYNKDLKKWFIPIHEDDCDYGKFIKWWPDSLKQFIFNDKYIIEEFFAKSGQAEVFYARDQETYEYCAIKYFRDEVPKMTEETIKRSVVRELDALLSLETHPNIVKMIDWGVREDTNRHFIISEWAYGGSLSDEIGRWSENTPSFQNDLWLTHSHILLGILEGITFAHLKGFYHRDIKPANILMEFKPDYSDQFPMICDFGTSKSFDDNQLKISEHTVVGMRTQPYRPEFSTYSELGQKELDNQNTWDIFAWAILSIEVMSNKFVETSEEAISILQKEISNQLGPELVGLLQNALAKDPRDRPKDTVKFRDKVKKLTAVRKKSAGWKE